MENSIPIRSKSPSIIVEDLNSISMCGEVDVAVHDNATAQRSRTLVRGSSWETDLVLEGTTELNKLNHKKLTPIPLRFADMEEYKAIFIPIVMAEYESKRSQIERSTYRIAKIEFSQREEFTEVHATLPDANMSDFKLLKHNTVTIFSENTNFKNTGRIISFSKKCDHDVSIRLFGPVSPAPSSDVTEFKLKLIFNGICGERMCAAIENLTNYSADVNTDVIQSVLGQAKKLHYPEYRTYHRTSLCAPNLPQLNNSQAKAVWAALNLPVTLIQGPPGTGKTVTAAVIVCELIRRHNMQILVCAPSNIATDHLANRIALTGLKVVRVYARSRNDELSGLALQNHVYKESLEMRGELYELQKRKDAMQVLTAEEELLYCSLKSNIEEQILKSASVIACTCVAAADSRLDNSQFGAILIDESTQSTETECIIPLALGTRKLILIGDHKQLGPIVSSQIALNAGFDKSLFERLVQTGMQRCILKTQYRMHPNLAIFPSNTFYQGSLENGVSKSQRTLRNIMFWPVADNPLMFYCTSGEEKKIGTTFRNETEVRKIKTFVDKLLLAQIKPSQIGIITAYAGQRSLLISSLKSLHEDGLEIENVNSFQGREKDFIVFSAVRSNEEGKVGFLHDPKRLNVALTRAKFGLIIVGNPRTLSHSPLWHQLIQTYKSNKLLVEGDLDSLSIYKNGTRRCCRRRYCRVRDKNREGYQFTEQQECAQEEPVPYSFVNFLRNLDLNSPEYRSTQYLQ